MVDFIDAHRARHGVEPNCTQLPIAPSTYHRYKQLECKPALRCERVKQDEQLMPKIQRVWDDSHSDPGILNAWRKRVLMLRLAVLR